MAFVIRDFKAEDFETLWRMDQDCFPPEIAYSKQELKSYMRPSRIVYAGRGDEEKGEIAGFIVVHEGVNGTRDHH